MTRVNWGLLLQQSLGAIWGRKMRSVMTAFGITVGILVFLVTLGWSLSASADINATFDERTATTITVTAREDAEQILDKNFTDRVTKMQGVKAAGRYSSAPQADCRTHPGETQATPIIVADPGFLQASGMKVKSGRFFDKSIEKIPGPVALLGPTAANNLGMTTTDGTTRIICDGKSIPVFGVLSSTGQAAGASSAVIISKNLDGSDVSYQAGEGLAGVVETELGATKKVAAALPYAVSARHSELVAVRMPPTTEELRGKVTTSLNTMAIGVSILSLVVGAIGIMTTTLTSVIERTTEIGLRRSLGARPRHIACQFIIEGVFLGGIGAFFGVLLGLVSLLVLVRLQGWTPVMYPLIPVLLIPGGMIIGILSSLVPALRAAKIPPAAALRH